MFRDIVISEEQDQRRKQFHLAHGGDENCVSIDVHRRFFYADGPRMPFEELHNGEPPPANDHARLSFILTYRKARLALATGQFSQRKQQLLGLCAVASREKQPPPNERVLEGLKELQEAVRHWQREVEKAEAELANTDESKMARADAERAAANLEAASMMAAKIADIKI